MLWFFIFIILIFLVYLFFPCRENFSDYSYIPVQKAPIYKRAFIKRFVPQVSLPPGFEEIDYQRGKRNPNKFRLDSNEEYCQKHPLCYPCPNWKFIGPPECVI